MSNMLAMDTDNDTVATIVVAEAVDGSNNIFALVTTQQSNKTMWKKTQFTWSHHGMNPKFWSIVLVQCCRNSNEHEFQQQQQQEHQHQQLGDVLQQQ